MHYPGDVEYHRWGEPATISTVLKLPRIIIREFDIPERFHKLVQVVDIALPNGEVDMGFAVGSNFQGLLPFRSGECLESIRKKLFEEKEPEWMLDNYRWKWVSQDRTSFLILLH